MVAKQTGADESPRGDDSAAARSTEETLTLNRTLGTASVLSWAMVGRRLLGNISGWQISASPSSRNAARQIIRCR